ncbi:MAG: inositol monophosphatase [Thermoanaerobaculum sp.]|nr:inositol monophosphatase [Thermoanaerobaculum sp.]MDW7967157.1 inositol monophosphatase family protein [Thermoanaerobaculum sp.]
MSTELAWAATAAQIGGEVLRRFFGKVPNVDEKARNDFVSTADRESEAAICAYLARMTPQCAFLGEEGGRLGTQQRCWVVDPLDGTTNFVRGFPHFAVSVALMEGAEVLVGAVYDPMRDELFTAARGLGAFRNGTRVRVSRHGTLEGSFLTTGFPFRMGKVLPIYLAIFSEVFPHAAAIRRPGAASLDLAHIACGIFDGFFEFFLSPWDLAAGVLLVREAAGVVTNLDGGEDLWTQGNVVAGNPQVHAALLTVVQRHTSEAALAKARRSEHD